MGKRFLEPASGRRQVQLQPSRPQVSIQPTTALSALSTFWPYSYISTTSRTRSSRRRLFVSLVDFSRQYQEKQTLQYNTSKQQDKPNHWTWFVTALNSPPSFSALIYQEVNDRRLITSFQLRKYKQYKYF